MLYLFGSWADPDRQPHRGSDLDIIVETETDLATIPTGLLLCEDGRVDAFWATIHEVDPAVALYGYASQEDVIYAVEHRTDPEVGEGRQVVVRDRMGSNIDLIPTTLAMLQQVLTLQQQLDAETITADAAKALASMLRTDPMENLAQFFDYDVDLTKLGTFELVPGYPIHFDPTRPAEL